MSTNTMLKTTLSKPEPQPMLTLNMRNLNQLFPGFTPGDFTLLRGSPAVTTLATPLYMRAQQLNINQLQRERQALQPETTPSTTPSPNRRPADQKQRKAQMEDS